MIFFKSKYIHFQVLVSLILFLGFSQNTLGQCAGTNGSVIVCDKDTDMGARTFALFPHLNGIPSAGGTWSTVDPANFFALNQSTGIVDLWRINNYGEHQFTYTNTACGELATVTVNLGGYPGENNIDGSANACSDDFAVNLHGFLGSEIDGKVQDFNGLWKEDPTTITGELEGNIFDARAAGPGIYIFTYTIAAVSSCPSRTSTVILEVHPAANSGLPISFTACTNEDFSAYTNFDLNSRLTSEDPNGTWSESGTNQLSDLNDSVINIEEINNTFGYDTYSFTYTVFPSHPVCEERSTIVNINILPALDGTMIALNFCFSTDYRINLNYDDTILHNGSFLLEYTINGRVAVASAVLRDGNGSFIVDSDIVPLNQFINLEITGIEGVTPMRDVCPRVIVPTISFLVSNTSANATDICVETTTTVSLTNILDPSGNRANGTYNIGYTLRNPSGTVSNFNLTNITLTNGNTNFTIDASNFTNGGDYDIDITIPNTFPINCTITDTFTVTPIPDAIQLDLLVDNNCDATLIDVIVDAPILASGTYTITYDVTELNTNNILTTNTINFTGGIANYQIDVAALPQGNYTANVRSTQDDNTPCRILFDFELTENFARLGIPDTPQAEATQIFCLSNYPSGPTLEDITITATEDILFYATATDTNILSLATPLLNGEDYFASNIDPTNNCEGSERVQISAILSDPPTPTSTTINPLFCAESNPTLSDLTVNIPTGNSVIWFDADTAGNILETNTPLIDGQNYYAATQSDGQCTSVVRLQFTPTVVTVAIASLEFTNLALCALDNPTVANLRVLENNSDNEIVWYNQIEGGNALADETLLIEGIIYYAESFNSDTGCNSTERVPVTIGLSNCIPQDYNFFIPDGFSPNGDGRNDTFYIPNIEIIFPDFTLEILNRYGTRLFKGDKNRPSWDGRNGSGIAPNGVYFYIIEYNKDELSPTQGRLYLNR